MMTITESTSAEAFNQYLRGKLIPASNGWKNLLVRVYSEPRVEESVIYPAVAEPRIVRILSGAAVVEERELGGHTHQTELTQFVNGAGIRFAYRRFGKSQGVPLVFF